MGLVMCKIHGGQQGPLCCEHVLDGSYGRASAVDPSAVALLRLDLFDDSSELLDIVLCQHCASRFGRTNGEVLASKHFGDEGTLPWICPICNPCLEKWRGQPTPGWSDGAESAS
jgi:hypothetical protein